MIYLLLTKIKEKIVKIWWDQQKKEIKKQAEKSITKIGGEIRNGENT